MTTYFMNMDIEQQSFFFKRFLKNNMFFLQFDKRGFLWG